MKKKQNSKTAPKEMIIDFRKNDTKPGNITQNQNIEHVDSFKYPGLSWAVSYHGIRKMIIEKFKTHACKGNSYLLM